MRYLVLVAALAALVASGCGGSDNTSTTTGADNTKPATTTPAGGGGDKAVAKATVEIKNFKYGPGAVTVKKGAKVTWKNADTAQHTATEDDRTFDTGTLNPGQKKVVTLSKPGTYSYSCQFHPFMKGRVVVQ
jgi:plastocyanin